MFISTPKLGPCLMKPQANKNEALDTTKARVPTISTVISHHRRGNREGLKKYKSWKGVDQTRTI